MDKQKKENLKKFSFLTDDDIAKLESLHMNVPFYSIKRFYLDIYSINLSFKNLVHIFKDVFTTSYNHDYVSPLYLDKLKVFIFHANSFLISFKKIIKNDFSSLSPIAEKNPKVYIILKLLYEINTESLTRFINSFNDKNIAAFELIYFLKEIYIPFLYISLIEWDVQEKLKITTNFNARSSSSDMANNILYALSLLTKFCRIKFNHDPGYSSHLFVDMMDSITFIIDNFPIIFSPIIFRILGYRKYNIKKERKFIDKGLILFFGLSQVDLKEEEEKIVTKEVENKEINLSDDEKIIFIPDEYKSAALLINLLLGIEFYQDQIRYPDYIGELLFRGFVNISRYKSINNQDPINYALSYLSILQLFLTEIEPEGFLDSSLIEVVNISIKQISELQSQIDFFYLKNLIEIRRMFEQNEKAIEQDYVKKVVDELNTFKKQYFFKHFFFVHFTNILNLTFQLTPFYEIVKNLFYEIERILVTSERRGEKKVKMEDNYYKWLDRIMIFKNTIIEQRFKAVFPEKQNYDPKTRRNFLYILYNFLKLGVWSFDQENSFFNSYPSLGFIKALDIGIAKLNVIESSEFYLYNRLQVELDKFKTLAYVDNLTGCYNKNFLQQQLLSDRSTMDKYVILYIDLDNFKYFNDNYSHETGDLILKEFGKILLKNCRDSDLPVRIGGDEFLVLLKSNAIETAIYFSKRIFEGIISINNYLKSLIELQFSKNLETYILFSIGATLFENNLEVSIKVADNLMYRAKKSGKNALAFYNENKLTVLRFKQEYQNNNKNNNNQNNNKDEN